MCKLTVFTATYNRGHLIERLYRSLQRQSSFDFEWLVIDDGSTDDTKELFEKWTKEDNHFVIRYYSQENKGLIRSLNRGIDLAQGVYFSKIDSDDFVTDSFITDISLWLTTLDEESVYAVAGVKIRADGTPIKGAWPEISDNPGYIDATDLERGLYNLDADMCEAWSTQVLKQYRFPVWANEKFAPEQLVFYQIAMEGRKIRWFPKPICVCEYQEDGLTKGADLLIKQNPMGYAMMYNQYLLIEKQFGRKFWNAMQMTALCFYANHLEYLKKSNATIMTILSFPFGILLGIRRHKQFMSH